MRHCPRRPFLPVGRQKDAQMVPKWYERKLQAYEAGGAWIVERKGKPVALLTDPQFEEMFWTSWKLEPLSDHPDERAVIFTTEYWDPKFDSETVYRSRDFGRVAPNAFPALDPFGDASDRLVMRALGSPSPRPWPWDRLIMWLRKRTKVPSGH